jgi:hypothetical protein
MHDEGHVTGLFIGFVRASQITVALAALGSTKDR